MSGRPRKKIDWYQHFTDMKNHPCVRALRRRFGNNGYAVLNYLMEDITRTDELVLNFTPKMRFLYSVEYDVTQQELEDIVDFCVELDLCKYSDDEKNKLRSPYLEEELLKLLLEKREKDRLRKQENKRKEFSAENNGYSTENDNDNIPRENTYIPRKTTSIPRKNTQSKVKKRKDNLDSLDYPRDAREGEREKKVPADAGDLKVCASVDEEVTDLRNSPIWKEQVFMRFKFLNASDAVLDQYFERWSGECKSKNIKHGTLGEARIHFVNWLIVQEDKSNRNGNSNGADNNNGYRSGEDILNGATGIIARMSTETKRHLSDIPVV